MKLPAGAREPRAAQDFENARRRRDARQHFARRIFGEHHRLEDFEIGDEGALVPEPFARDRPGHLDDAGAGKQRLIFDPVIVELGHDLRVDMGAPLERVGRQPRADQRMPRARRQHVHRFAGVFEAERLALPGIGRERDAGAGIRAGDDVHLQTRAAHISGRGRTPERIDFGVVAIEHA